MKRSYSDREGDSATRGWRTASVQGVLPGPFAHSRVVPASEQRHGDAVRATTQHAVGRKSCHITLTTQIALRSRDGNPPVQARTAAAAGRRPSSWRCWPSAATVTRFRPDMVGWWTVPLLAVQPETRCRSVRISCHSRGRPKSRATAGCGCPQASSAVARLDRQCPPTAPSWRRNPRGVRGIGH